MENHKEIEDITFNQLKAQGKRGKKATGNGCQGSALWKELNIPPLIFR